MIGRRVGVRCARPGPQTLISAYTNSPGAPSAVKGSPIVVLQLFVTRPLGRTTRSFDPQSHRARKCLISTLSDAVQCSVCAAGIHRRREGASPSRRAARALPPESPPRLRVGASRRLPEGPARERCSCARRMNIGGGVRTRGAPVGKHEPRQGALERCRDPAARADIIPAREGPERSPGGSRAARRSMCGFAASMFAKGHRFKRQRQ